MTSSDVGGEQTAARYDADSADQFAPEVLGPAVDFLARLAGSGAALEFAIGTGRVGIPLAARGVPVVTGIELSEAMLEQRLAGWDGSPFTADSESHISVWRKPEPEADRGGGRRQPG